MNGMRFFSICASVALLSAACTAIAQQPAATITIQSDKPLHKVSPTLYGLMTEEINYSYDGGLYAEMVRNRSFEHDWGGFEHWTLVEQGTGRQQDGRPHSGPAAKPAPDGERRGPAKPSGFAEWRVLGHGRAPGHNVYRIHLCACDRWNAGSDDGISDQRYHRQGPGNDNDAAGHG